jgi:ubiquinone/menaquinone biosynthesis C-methylase UbiE
MNAFDHSVKKFNEFASEYSSRFMNIDAYRDSIDQFCSSLNTESPKILELACGPGNVTRYLRYIFPNSKILAIDLAPNMIDIARQYLNDVDFKLMDVRTISKLNETYDLIMCSFCLPFLSGEDTQSLISDCYKLLNKNGKVYISTMEGDESNAGYEKTSFSSESEIYFNYHRQSDLENMFTKSGLKIDYLKRQEYKESDGTTLTDMIFIGTKK